MTTIVNTTFKQIGYKKTFHIPIMIKSLEDSLIFNKLRMVQQDEFNRIKKEYNEKGFLQSNYLLYLKDLFWNFVLNNFEFKDKKTESQSIQVKKPKHIGMKKFMNLNVKC